MNSSSYDFIKFTNTFPGIKKPQVFKWFAKLLLSFWRFRSGLFGLVYEIISTLSKNLSFKKIKEAKVLIFTEMSSEENNQITLSKDLQNKSIRVPRVTHSLSSNDLR